MNTVVVIIGLDIKPLFSVAQTVIFEDILKIAFYRFWFELIKILNFIAEFQVLWIGPFFYI